MIDIVVKGLHTSDFYKIASTLMFELENEIDFSTCYKNTFMI